MILSNKIYRFAKHFDACEIEEINTFIRENRLDPNHFVTVYCDDFYTLYYNEV